MLENLIETYGNTPVPPHNIHSFVCGYLDACEGRQLAETGSKSGAVIG
jgi:hypothetical protein